MLRVYLNYWKARLRAGLPKLSSCLMCHSNTEILQDNNLLMRVDTELVMLHWLRQKSKLINFRNNFVQTGSKGVVIIKELNLD